MVAKIKTISTPLAPWFNLFILFTLMDPLKMRNKSTFQHLELVSLIWQNCLGLQQQLFTRVYSEEPAQRKITNWMKTVISEREWREKVDLIGKMLLHFVIVFNTWDVTQG